MKIAVTGGAGFLGYHIANILSRRGNDMLLLDVAPFHEEDYEGSGPGNVTWDHADVRDQDAMDRLLKGMDVVIHAAAALPLWAAKDIYTTNISGTITTLRAARKNKAERVVYVSSTAVYGVPEHHPLYETDELIGVGPYGNSKIRAEEMCLVARDKGMVVPIIRPKTFIGTGRLGVFQILYDWVESGKRIPVLGNGNNHYQLLEVEDLVNAIYLAATCPADKANDTFNVGAKRYNTVREDVGEMCDYAGTGARVMSTPAGLIKPALAFFEAIHLSPLYKWVYGTADKDSFVSTEKIEKTLGWEPKFSNADALIRSYQWYLDHKDELETGTGVTHRIAWDQGILKYFKRFM
ncbi:MAG: NAD-dependent epimerase/dehydratase family protein [Chloroflexia bacterium]